MVEGKGPQFWAKNARDKESREIQSKRNNSEKKLTLRKVFRSLEKVFQRITKTHNGLLEALIGSWLMNSCSDYPKRPYLTIDDPKTC